MDTVGENLKAIRSRVVIPTSIPGLVTDRVLVMSYLNGVPLTQLHKHASDLPEWKKKAAIKQVLYPHLHAAAINKASQLSA